MSANQEPRIEELQLRLLRNVDALCPLWLADRKEDIVHNAIIKVLKIVRRAEGKREFSSFYLRKLAYSALVDEIRRLRRRREISLDSGNQRALADSKNTTNPASALRSQEIGSGILECLKQLPRARRIAVTLYLQGHRVPELTKLVGWNYKKAENLVYRGLAALKNCLNSKGLKP